jgi:outer membrane lipoprotein carrier protein
MRKIILACFLVLSVSTLWGQNQDAKAILDKMSETYKAMPGFELSFDQKLEDAGDNIYSGTTAVSKERFFVSFQGQLIFSDGPTLWTYIVEGEELTISNFEPDEQAINPANIYDIYKEGFEFQFLRADSYNDESVNVIELNSTDPDADFTTIVMYVGTDDYYLKGWDLIDYDGIATSFAVTKFTPNRSFDDGYFRIKVEKKGSDSFFTFDNKQYKVDIETDLRN